MRIVVERGKRKMEFDVEQVLTIDNSPPRQGMDAEALAQKLAVSEFLVMKSAIHGVVVVKLKKARTIRVLP